MEIKGIESRQINEWVKRAYDNAVKHGWHEEKRSNLGSVCQSVLLSVFNWAEALEIDLVQHINLKMRYNESRKYLHGNKLY